MGAIILDIRRVLSLIWIGLKFEALPLLRRVLGLPPRGLSVGVRLRLAFEELGTTYLKLGQFLTMRFDVLPLDVCSELNKLFETVTPMGFEEAQRLIESELKKPLHELFPVFAEKPLAAASIAQVHFAHTQNNERVAVKVQRAGIDRLFAADMRNLKRLAGLIDATGVAGEFSASEVADQFAAWTAREMDFEMEGRTADRMRMNAGPYEVIPRIYWPLTAKKVLTMEFVDGVSLAKIGQWIDDGRVDLISQALPHLDVEKAGHNIAFAVLRQFFVSGLFQGDPHPGNILIRDDNRVAFVDFGIFGELTTYQRENFAGFLENLALGDIDQSFNYYARQHVPTAGTDFKAFQREGKEILRAWHHTSTNRFTTARQRHMGKYAVRMIESIRRHKLQTNSDILLLWRALYALDASSERLSEYFDMMGQVRQFFTQVRPGPASRVVNVHLDPERNRALRHLVSRSPGFSQDLLERLTRTATLWPIEDSEVESLRRSRGRELKWLTFGILAISLGLAASSPHLPASFKMIVLTLAASAFGFLALR